MSPAPAGALAKPCAIASLVLMTQQKGGIGPVTTSCFTAIAVLCQLVGAERF